MINVDDLQTGEGNNYDNNIDECYENDSPSATRDLGTAFLSGFYGLPHARAHPRRSGLKFSREQCHPKRSHKLM